MASKCHDPELVQVLDEYRDFSQRRLGRLQEVFRLTGLTPIRRPSAGINGMIAEFSDFLETRPDPRVLDVYAVESARRVERYATCAYQAVITISAALRMDASTELLAANLAEHHKAGDGFKALSVNLTDKLLAGARK